MKVTGMMKRKQSGLTLGGMLISLVVVLFFAYAGMRVVPMYLEYHALTQALSQLENDPGAKNMTAAKLKNSITNALWASYASDNIKKENIHISKKSNGVNVTVKYEVRKPFMGNIDIVGSFQKTAVLK
jgi:hypothetical protein